MTIDDQTRRRTTKTGLTALDRDRACPGYTLYSPMNGPGDVYLLNLDGEEVQTREEIGHRFGITRERIRQLQNGALAKLRKMLDQLEASPQ